jgi:hypothetical protein
MHALDKKPQKNKRICSRMHKPCMHLSDNPQLFLTEPSPLASDPFMILSLLQVLMNMLQRHTRTKQNQTPSKHISESKFGRQASAYSKGTSPTSMRSPSLSS